MNGRAAAPWTACVGVSVIYRPVLGTKARRHHLSRMEARLIIAYALIALMVLAVVAWAAYARHNTHARKIARRRGRSDDARVKAIQELL